MADEWQIGVPELVRVSEVVNRHIELFNKHDPGTPPFAHNDELELLGALLGLGRWIELNVRIAHQLLLGTTGHPRKYNEVRKGIGEALAHYDDDGIKTALSMLELAQVATDGLGHGNLPTTQGALATFYDRHSDLTERRFPLITIVGATITREGLNLDVSDPLNPTARDNKGKAQPTTVVKPHKAKSVEGNIKEFYATGMFVNLFEVLYLTAPEAVKLREMSRRKQLVAGHS